MLRVEGEQLKWSGREGSNLRPPRPKRGALPLRYTPVNTVTPSAYLSCARAPVKFMQSAGVTLSPPPTPAAVSNNRRGVSVSPCALLVVSYVLGDYESVFRSPRYSLHAAARCGGNGAGAPRSASVPIYLERPAIGKGPSAADAHRTGQLGRTTARTRVLTPRCLTSWSIAPRPIAGRSKLLNSIRAAGQIINRRVTGC